MSTARELVLLAVAEGCVPADDAQGLELAMSPGDAPDLRGGGPGAHLAFFGFASEADMRRLVGILRHAFSPALLQAAIMSDMRFEGILSVPRDSASAERVLALFKMHIGVVHFDTYMSGGMAACLQRVVAAPGSGAGNFFEPTNLLLRSDLLAHEHSAQPPAATPPAAVGVLLLVHGGRRAWFRGPVAVYEARENVFLHAHSVMYTPSHMLHSAAPPPPATAHGP